MQQNQQTVFKNTKVNENNSLTKFKGQVPIGETRYGASKV